MNDETDISDYNLEFAHVMLTGRSFNRDEVLKSAEIAKQELERIQTNGSTCAVCILIDDKHVEHKLTYKDLPVFRDFVTQHFSRVDYICFEKDLSKYKEKIFEKLRPESRDHVEAEIWRYQKTHRQLGCSHDIAIWHMIRLGLINDIDAATLIPVGWGVRQGRSPPFVARRIISILSRKDEDFEKKAYEDILKQCIDESAIRNIERIYYP
jgi:hypothetical protein